MPYAKRRAPVRRGRRLQGSGSTTSRFTPYVRTANAIYSGARAGYKAAKVYRDARGMYRDRSSESSSAGRMEYHRPTKWDLQKINSRYGRRISNSTFMRRALNAAKSHQTLLAYRYGNWASSGGMIPIRNARYNISSDPLDSHLELPVHLYDVTATCQVTNASGELRYPQMGYRLLFSNNTSSANCEWRTMDWSTDVTGNKTPSVTTTSGNTQGTFTVIDDSNPGLRNGTHSSNNALVAKGKSFISSVSAKFLFYGPTSAPTKYCVQLVWLHHDVQPHQNTQLSRAFWQSVARSYAYNPLETGNTRLLRKYMKVKKSIYIDSESPETIEDLAYSRQKQVNFYARLNKRVNYDWNDNEDSVNPISEDVHDGASGTLANQPSCFVHPNGRLFIMVRALVEHTDGSTSYAVRNAAKEPGYDMKLHVNHRTLDRNA